MMAVLSVGSANAWCTVGTQYVFSGGMRTLENRQNMFSQVVGITAVYFTIKTH